MFSVVIPLGDYPFFLDACVGNIEQTCGRRLEEVDLVFLLSESSAPQIRKALVEAAKRAAFRVIGVPINLAKCQGTSSENINHLRLLYWAVHHADLRDWMLVQHCDFFLGSSAHWLVRLSQQFLKFRFDRSLYRRSISPVHIRRPPHCHVTRFCRGLSSQEDGRI